MEMGSETLLPFLDIKLPLSSTAPELPFPDPKLTTDWPITISFLPVVLAKDSNLHDPTDETVANNNVIMRIS